MKFIFTIYKFDINSMIYIGSTWNFNKRKVLHKHDCYNENSNGYNMEIYKYIRENNIDWNDITIEDIYNKELDEKDNLLKRQTEQKYIDQYDSKNNGLNTRYAYINEDWSQKEYDRIRYINNRDKILAQKRIYDNKNKEKKKEYCRKYREHKRNEKMCGEIVNELINNI